MVSEVALKIGGMTCELCSERIRESLQNEDGVLDVQVFLGEGKAIIHYDPQVTSPEKISRSNIFTDTVQVEAAGGRRLSHRYRAELLQPDSCVERSASSGAKTSSGVSQASGSPESRGVRAFGSQAPPGSSSTRSMLMLALAVAACCVLPLALLLGGGLAFYAYLRGNYLILSITLLVILALTAFAVIFAKKRRKSVLSCG